MQLPHPANFMFDQSEVAGVQVHSPVPWLVRLRLDLESDPSREIWHDVAPLFWRELLPQTDDEAWSFELQTLTWTGPDGRVHWQGHADGWLGFCERHWLVRLASDPSLRFHGLGQKAGPFEKSGLRTLFFNTDLWGSYYLDEVRHGRPDPQYISIPWILIDHRRNEEAPAGVSGILARCLSVCSPICGCMKARQKLLKAHSISVRRRDLWNSIWWVLQISIRWCSGCML